MWFLDDAHEDHEEATSAVFAWIPAGVSYSRTNVNVRVRQVCDLFKQLKCITAVEQGGDNYIYILFGFLMTRTKGRWGLIWPWPRGSYGCCVCTDTGRTRPCFASVPAG